jgi:hypothetical protein
MRSQNARKVISPAWMARTEAATPSAENAACAGVAASRFAWRGWGGLV